MKRSCIVLLLLLIHHLLFAVSAFAYNEDTGALDREGKKGMMRGAMICPVLKGGQPYMVVTSPQGWRIHPITGNQSYHKGVDLDADMGDDIVAAAAGTVILAGWVDGYGNTVMINHGGDLTTLYGHNSSVVVSDGQSVQQGQLIAKAGSTGNSTGPHCHFEVLPDGDSAVDPGLYVPGLLELERAEGGGNIDGHAPHTDSHGSLVDFTVANDFAKPVYDVIEKTVDLARKGISLVREYIASIFFVLITIDLALGAMAKVTASGSDQEPLMRWIIQRTLFYGLCAFLLFEWSDVVGNLSLSGLPVLGGLAGGHGAEGVQASQNALSDPTQIIQKGVSIIAPVINEAMKVEGIMDLVFHGQTALICLVFGGTLFILFCIIGLQIAIAYIEFYLVILFSFTSFTFAGEKHVRKYASNGLNGVFAVSLNIMFFCLFSLMLQTTLEKIAVEGLVTQNTVAEARPSGGGATGAAGEPIKSMQDLMSRIRQVESYYGNYHCDNGLGYYGAYQINKDYWDNWCGRFMNASPSVSLDTDANYTRWTGSGAYDTAPEPTHTAYPWSPKNQDLVAEFVLTGYYLDYGSYEAAARAWTRGTGNMWDAEGTRYWNEVLGKRGDGGGSSEVMSVKEVANIVLLMQLTLITLMFMFFADRVSKFIMTQFGQPGFRLTNEQ